MKQVFFLFIFLILFSNLVYPATVQGTIYDLSLNKIKNTIVVINSVPEQKILSQDGTYSFNLSSGSYNITVKTNKNVIITKENIEIKQEGTFNIDLFAFPDLSEDILTEALNLDIVAVDENKTTLDIKIIFIPILILILIILAIAYFKTSKKKTQETKNQVEETKEKDLAERVLEKIKQNSNRITQKELRKQFPFSEAKVSLVLTELESKGKIEKIKKGRGNIIILKK